MKWVKLFLLWFGIFFILSIIFSIIFTIGNFNPDYIAYIVFPLSLILVKPIKNKINNFKQKLEVERKKQKEEYEAILQELSELLEVSISDLKDKKIEENLKIKFVELINKDKILPSDLGQKLKRLKVNPKNLGKQILEHLVEIYIADGILTEEEEKKLTNVINIFELSEKDLEKIYSKKVRQFFEQKLKKFLEDGMLSPEEKEEIEKLVSGLKIKLSEEDRAYLEKANRIWEILNGKLTPIPCPINLQKNEECYYHIENVEMKKWGKERVSYGGVGVSIKVAKGVRLYTGSGGSTTKDTLKTEDIGEIFITNKRIIFVGNKKTTSIKWDKILDVNIFEGGFGLSPMIEVKRETGSAIIFDLPKKADPHILSAIINRILKADF